MEETKKPWYKSTERLMTILVASILIGGLGFGLVQNMSSDEPIGQQQAPANKGSADAQVIRMGVTGSQYMPSTLSVSAGQAVKWLIDGSKAQGCTEFLISPELGVSTRLKKGENVVEFTAPQEKGAYGFSCSIGMVKGTINVV